MIAAMLSRGWLIPLAATATLAVPAIAIGVMLGWSGDAIGSLVMVGVFVGCGVRVFTAEEPPREGPREWRPPRVLGIVSRGWLIPIIATATIAVPAIVVGVALGWSQDAIGSLVLIATLVGCGVRVFTAEEPPPEEA